MNFLSKILGAIVKVGSLIVTGFPMFSQFIPKSDQAAAQTALGDLQQFLGVSQTVEVTASALSAADNTDGKITAVSQGIAQVILASPALTGHKIQDPAAFQQATNYFALGSQALLASLHPAGVAITDKTTTA